MSYQYTYPDATDEVGFENLTPEIREFGQAVNERARDGEFNGDRRDILHSLNVPAEWKVALAEIWGGPGAGDEFR